MVRVQTIKTYGIIIKLPSSAPLWFAAPRAPPRGAHFWRPAPRLGALIFDAPRPGGPGASANAGGVRWVGNGGNGMYYDDVVSEAGEGRSVNAKPEGPKSEGADGRTEGQRIALTWESRCSWV
jgi:hypothetical protein